MDYHSAMQTLAEWIAYLNAGENERLRQFLLSFVVIGGAVVLRSVAQKVIRNAEIGSADLRRRWMVGSRNFILVVALFALMLIWVHQLQNLAVSLVAFAAVIVISLKELILCITGSMLKIGARAFVLGDRISVGTLRGDVIDQTLLSTTLLEVGPGEALHQHSGRKVTIPNAMFLAMPVVNESIVGAYTVHSFVVPVKRTEDPTGAEKQLLEAAAEVVKPYKHEALAALEAFTQREAVEGPSVEPRVTFLLPDAERVDLVVRVPVPSDGKRGVQQQIVRRFLELRHAAEPTRAHPTTDDEKDGMKDLATQQQGKADAV